MIPKNGRHFESLAGQTSVTLLTDTYWTDSHLSPYPMNRVDLDGCEPCSRPVYHQERGQLSQAIVLQAKDVLRDSEETT